MPLPTAGQVLNLLRTGTAEQRVAFARSLPESDFDVSALVGSSSPGIVVVSLGSATLKYCYGQHPEWGAVLAPAVHERAVELWQTVPGHGLLPTTLSNLASAHVKALSLLGRSSEILDATARYIPFYENLPEPENLPALKVMRIEALVNLKRIDEARAALGETALLRHPIWGMEARRLKGWVDRFAAGGTRLPSEQQTVPVSPTSQELSHMLKGAIGIRVPRQAREQLQQELRQQLQRAEQAVSEHKAVDSSRVLAEEALRRDERRRRSSASLSPKDDDSLGLDELMSAGTTAESSAPLPETRWLNAEIRNHDKAKALQPGKTYELEFGVDLQAAGDAGTPLPSVALLFKDDEDVVDLTIELHSTDFGIATRQQTLSLPRFGASANRPHFEIKPLRPGRGTIAAVVSKGGNFLLRMDIAYSIGEVASAPPSTETFGRPLVDASNLDPRRLSFVFKPAPSGGYECITIGGHASLATLPISEVGLADGIATARKALMSVVAQRDAAAQPVFQKGIKIDGTSAAKALRTLAHAGARLFDKLFFGPDAGLDVQRVGELIRDEAMRPGLTLQVISQRFPVPWALLYLGEADKEATLSWDNFLGMRCIIEVLPLAKQIAVGKVIRSDQPALAVSVNINHGIDAQMNTNVVARQVEFWRESTAKLGTSVQFAQRQSGGDFLDALAANAGDQLMYLYCHAVTAGPEGAGGISASSLVLTGDDRITLDDLYREAPIKRPLPGKPLVFINACETAELTPAFYDGFVPYFVAKGARGVIGTECKVPAVFATEWALRFFPRFLGGEPLGEAFLALRREFCARHNNPLGLLYAVYCNADTRIQPGLKLQ